MQRRSDERTTVRSRGRGGIASRVVVNLALTGLLGTIAFGCGGQTSESTGLLDESDGETGVLRIDPGLDQPSTASTTTETTGSSVVDDDRTNDSGDVSVSTSSSPSTVLAPGRPSAATKTTRPPAAANAARITSPSPLPLSEPFTGTPAGSSAWVSAAAIDVFANPGDAEPIKQLANPARFQAPLVMLVREQRDEGWVQVLLPERPNESFGWVRAADVVVRPNEYRVAVSLGSKRLQLFERDVLVKEVSVATGKPKTPTPTGRFYITAVLWTGRPTGAYGPAALALSGFSNVLTEFAGGDGQIALHGTNRPTLLGTQASHGCVRLPNDIIDELAKTMPLGTPVEIVP